MKKTFTFFAVALFLFTMPLFSQVAINTDGSSPDGSAMLDVKSSTMGMLIPRMTNTEVNAINDPAAGLMVYNTTQNNFFFYTGTGWNQVSGGGDSDWIISGNEMYSAVSGDVGIGISNPNEKLEVAGDGRVFIGDGGGSNRTGLLIDGIESGNNVRLQGYDYGTATGMNINLNPMGGFIGVGVNDPLQDFHVQGNSYFDGNVGIGTSSPSHSLMVSSADTNAVFRLTGPDGNYEHGARLNFGDGDYVYIEEDEDDMILIYSSLRKSFMGGDVGIGTLLPTRNLHVEGTMRLTGALYDVNNVAGTSGQVLSTTGTGVDWIDVSSTGADNDWTVSGNSMYSAVSGNVGIGTSKPESKLHIDYPTGGTSPALFLSDFPGSAGELAVPDGQALDFGHYNTTTSTFTPDISVSGAGNVGIGTSTPAQKLHLSALSGDVSLLIEADPDNNNEDDNPKLIFSQDGGAVQTYVGMSNNSNDFVINHQFNAAMGFNTNSARRITILGNGNVGIGTDNPGNKLHITGQQDQGHMVTITNNSIDGGDGIQIALSPGSNWGRENNFMTFKTNWGDGQKTSGEIELWDIDEKLLPDGDFEDIVCELISMGIIVSSPAELLLFIANWG